jgi:hypothetical protein
MNKKWLKAAAIRAVKTVAQTAAAIMSTSAMLSEINWVSVLSASLLAGILSILTSVAGLPEVKSEE